jgi:hypothetical protein
MSSFPAMFDNEEDLAKGAINFVMKYMYTTAVFKIQY